MICTPESRKMRFKQDGDTVTVYNDFIEWQHSADVGGELVSAIVKNGSGKNLLTSPQSTSLCPWVRGGWRQFHFYNSNDSAATKMTVKDTEDGVLLSYSSTFADAEGKVLPNAAVQHTVLFCDDGAAEHTVKITLKKDMDLGSIQIGTLHLRDDMDRIAVRPCSQATWALELQNPCQWIDLKHGKNRLDLPAYSSRFLPLSVLFLKNGCEAIEMSLGDDLSQWDNIGTDFPGVARGAVYEMRDPWHYDCIFAPLESPRAGNILKKGTYTFEYRLSLPFIKKNIQPLMPASDLMQSQGKTSATRFLTKSQLCQLKEDGVSLLKIHNDGDIFGDGIFWHDAAYPPYPPKLLKKMDDAIAAANGLGIDVVPYFSCKEYHPEAQGFQRNAKKCARQVKAGETFMENFFGTSLFGMQMCLKSKWFDIRKKTIEQVLSNHAFHGLYFDWTMGLECIHPEHNNGKRHWDNDKLRELLRWGRKRIGENGKLYLHLTNVPSIALENMADLILTEETEYHEFTPEMFTPYVSFLNIAPRSICNMIFGDYATPENQRRLALTALLYHVTVSSPGVSLKMWQEHKDLLDSLTAYERIVVPGESSGCRVENPQVGMTVYHKRTGGKYTLVFVNFSEKEISTEYTATFGKHQVKGSVKVPALGVASVNGKG